MKELSDYSDLEDKLSEREEFFRTMIERQTDAISCWLPDTTLLYVNDAFCMFWGMPREEMEGNPWLSFLTRENEHTASRCYVEELLADPRPRATTTLLCFPDGTGHWVMWCDYPIFGDQGQLLGFESVGRDITALKGTEQELQAQQRVLRALLDNIPDPAWLEDPQGRLLAVNEPSAQFFGKRREEMLGESASDLVPQFADKFVEDGSLLSLECPRSRVEQQLIDLNGQRVWFDTIESLILDERGEITGIAGIARNITERKLAEEALAMRLQQQASIAKVGLSALSGTELTSLMHEVLEAVQETLHVPLSVAAELFVETRQVKLRHSGGWIAQYECESTLPVEEFTCCTYTLQHNSPTIIDDLATESRFTLSRILRENQVVSGITVVIPGKDRPFGMLGVCTREKRCFTQDDVNYLQAMANVLANAIGRQRSMETLQRYQLLSENAHDIILHIRADGKILEANRAACLAYGYSIDELLAMEIADLRGVETRVSIQQQMEMAAEQGILFETLHQRKDGSIFPVEVSAQSAPFGGEQALVSIIRDITERKRAEQVMRLNEMRANILLQLHQMSELPAEEVIAYAIEHAIKLTNSSIGYIGFVSEDGRHVTIHQMPSSVLDHPMSGVRPGVYAIDDAPLWREIVQQPAVAIADYVQGSPNHPCPPVYTFPVTRYIEIPIVEGDRLVAIGGVADKRDEYSPSEISDFRMVIHTMWMLLERKRAAAERAEMEIQLRRAKAGSR